MEERDRLEKMEMLRSRFHISYARAREVLEACGWDTVEATIKLEAEGGRPPVEELKVTGKDLIETLKRLLHEGNINRIIVRDGGGRELLNLPVNGLIVVTALLPILTAIGAVVAVAMEYTIQVERQD